MVNLPFLKDYTSYFNSILSISGILLGLVFAALIYVLQSGFTTFQFSRRMFLEVYALYGRHILYVLAYLTIVSFLILYLPKCNFLHSIVYYLFSVWFLKTYLDLQKHLGYIHTLFSARNVPRHYGVFRGYFRLIYNLGFTRNILILSYLFIFIGSPILISYSQTRMLVLTYKGFFYSTFLLLIYSILQIANFIPHFFYFTGLEAKSIMPYEDNELSTVKNSDVDFKREKEELLRYLERHGITEVDYSRKANFLDGTISINLLLENIPEAWFNIYVEISNATVFEIRESVVQYAIKLLDKIRSSFVDINSFVLSFHIKAGGEDKTRNIFIRSNRNELDNVFSQSRTPDEIISMIENKLFDELYRDLKRNIN